MEILTKDERGLTDVNPINFKSDDIIFYDMTINGSYAGCIADMVKGNNYFVGEETYKLDFGDGVEIYHVGGKGNHFVVEYNSKEQRDKNKELLKKKFTMDGEHFSEELEEKRQVPEFQGYFDYEGKYYNILNGLNKLTDETNKDLGVYKGVIVNPELYFGKVGNEISDKKDQIDKIL